MRRKASTPRRSRGVLAFLRVQLQRNVDEEGGKYTESSTSRLNVRKKTNSLGLLLTLASS